MEEIPEGKTVLDTGKTPQKNPIFPKNHMNQEGTIPKIPIFPQKLGFRKGQSPWRWLQKRRKQSRRMKKNPKISNFSPKSWE